MWPFKKKKKPPTHDCRRHLPHPERYPRGALLVCPSCLSLRVRDEYSGDDLWGGTTDYLTWRKARPSEYPLSLPPGSQEGE